MNAETQAKPRPQVVKLDRALKLAEAWVNNMSSLDADEPAAVEFQGRPPRLGLGAKARPQSEVAAAADPVQRKLLAKLNAGKKRAAKDLEESNADGRNEQCEDCCDDFDDLESRANVFVKRKARDPITSLQLKKKGKPKTSI